MAMKSLELTAREESELGAELQRYTATQNARLILSRRTPYTDEHIFAASSTVADVTLSYFYSFKCVGRDWGRFAFEGDVARFRQWLAEHHDRRYTLHASRTFGHPGYPRPVPAPPSSSSSSSSNTSSSASGTATHVSRSTSATCSRRPVPPGSGFLALPQELRDLIFAGCCPSVRLVSHYDSSSQAWRASLVAPTGLHQTSHRLHAEYRQSLASLRTSSWVLVSDPFCVEWDTLPVASSVCLEFRDTPSFDGLRCIFDRMRNINPQLYRQKITLVFHSSTEPRPYAFVDLMYHLRRRADVLQVVVKQHLLVDDEKPSDFTTYYTSPHMKLRHCLRSDDFVGYLDILDSPEQPTAGEHILRALYWDCVRLYGISSHEAKALDRALPPSQCNTPTSSLLSI